MNRFSFPGVTLVLGAAFAASLVGTARVSAQPGPDGNGAPNGGPPVYQWHPSDGHRRDDRRDRRDFRRDARFVSPQVSAGWFQRPYPYHLDYYKMRYGGTYAPYFGNLYGTPQVVNYPPYYGPYYTGYGLGYGNGYGQPGYGGAPMEYPPNSGAMMPGLGVEQSSADGAASGNPAAKSTGDLLPAPTP